MLGNIPVWTTIRPYFFARIASEHQHYTWRHLWPPCETEVVHGSGKVNQSDRQGLKIELINRNKKQSPICYCSDLPNTERVGEISGDAGGPWLPRRARTFLIRWSEEERRER